MIKTTFLNIQYINTKSTYMPTAYLYVTIIPGFKKTQFTNIGTEKPTFTHCLKVKDIVILH